MAGRARRTVLSALAHPLVMLLVFTAALLYVRPALRDAAPCADSLAATLPAGQHEALLRSYESQRSALELLDAQIERAGGDPVLERQRDLMAEDVALLGRACEAEDARELLRAVATYDERLAERGQTAHNGAYLGAEAALYRALAELDDPRVIDNSGEMPAVVYLATNQFALAPVVFAIADRIIMLDKQTRSIIANGPPALLRDTSPNEKVRAFLTRDGLKMTGSEARG